MLVYYFSVGYIVFIFQLYMRLFGSLNIYFSFNKLKDTNKIRELRTSQLWLLQFAVSEFCCFAMKCYCHDPLSLVRLFNMSFIMLSMLRDARLHYYFF